MPSIGTHQISRSAKRRVNQRLKRLNYKVNCDIPTCVNNIRVESNQTNQPTIDYSPEILLINPAPDVINNESPVQSQESSLSEKELVGSLRDWAESNKIHGTAITSLLKVLGRHHCFKNLPKDSRTLRKTPRDIKIYEVEPGQYCHFPLAESISRFYNYYECKSDEISVQLNVDGLPISKSSSQQFWPVLGHIVNIPSSKPFVIGLYFGNDKPKSSNSLLRLAVNDFLISNFILIGDRQVSVNVHSVVCDAPARSFLLNVKGHTGYFACHKCNIEGEYFNRRMTFPGTCQISRTDQTFRQKLHEDFHLQSDTELLRLPLDLVSQVPLDYQHLVCLGATRKVINLWVRGKLNKFRFQNKDTLLLSQNLIILKQFFPKEFPRKPRSLQHLKNWKATEYRTFLLYAGPIALQSILPKNYYDHFMCLHVAIRILCSAELQSKYINYAEELLAYFVDAFATLYGQEQVSYNIHNLRHLSADSRKFGPLDSFSTFKFENYLGEIKRLLKSGNRPLEQVYNRVSESNAKYSTGTAKNRQNEEFNITTNRGDNACELLDGSVYLVECISENNDQLIFEGKKLINPSPLYEVPCSSELLGIRTFSQTGCSELIDVSQVKRKVIVFNFKNRLTSIPLLHLN